MDFKENSADVERQEVKKTKKATNRDVARLAGVSVATVSYIINKKENQHITEETKKRVYQAMNMLNYIPNPYAVGLNSKQPKTIMLRSSKDITPLSECAIALLMRSISAECLAEGYQVIYSTDKTPIKVPADACVCCGFSEEEFRALADENFIPVIAVDSLINDPLFFRIGTDYDKVLSSAAEYFKGENFVYATLTPTDGATKEKILSTFKKVRFISSVGDLKELAADGKNIAVSDYLISELITPFVGGNVFSYSRGYGDMAKAIVDSAFKAIGRAAVANEEHFILI